MPTVAAIESQAAGIRALSLKCPYLTIFDIAAVTAVPLAEVRAALAEMPRPAERPGFMPVYAMRDRLKPWTT